MPVGVGVGVKVGVGVRVGVGVMVGVAVGTTAVQVITLTLPMHPERIHSCELQVLFNALQMVAQSVDPQTNFDNVGNGIGVLVGFGRL